MTARKANRYSPILIVPLGSGPCGSDALAAGAADAVRQGGPPASPAQADPRAFRRGPSARVRETFRPQTRRKALAIAQRRLQRQRAVGTGQPLRPSLHAMPSGNQRS